MVVPFGNVPDWRFGSVVEQPDADRSRRLLAALAREAAGCAGEFRGTTFTSVYLAGGPTCLTLDQLYAALQLVYDNLTITPEEQSLDVVPETIDEGRAKVLRESGFDRLNIRLVEGRSPEHELAVLAGAGFESVGVEIPFGAALETWLPWFERLVELKPARIHLRAIAAADESRTMQTALEQARQRLAGGWHEYLLLHFCRPGHENRHLVSLWCDTAQVGLGPAAITRTAQVCRRNPAKLKDYLAAAKAGRPGKPAAAGSALLSELVRLEGIAAQQLKPESRRTLLESGLLEDRGGQLFLAAAGALALDRVSALLA